MKHWERESKKVIGQEVIITSWWDITDETWRAQSQSYKTATSDGQVVTGESREEAIGNLVSLLADYLEMEQ